MELLLSSQLILKLLIFEAVSVSYKVNFQWVFRESAVEEGKKGQSATCVLESQRIQAKVESAKLTAKSPCNPCHEMKDLCRKTKESALETWRQTSKSDGEVQRFSIRAKVRLTSTFSFSSIQAKSLLTCVTYICGGSCLFSKLVIQTNLE